MRAVSSRRVALAMGLSARLARAQFTFHPDRHRKLDSAPLKQVLVWLSRLHHELRSGRTLVNCAQPELRINPNRVHDAERPYMSCLAQTLALLVILNPLKPQSDRSEQGMGIRSDGRNWADHRYPCRAIASRPHLNTSLPPA